jgi:hypothetical protein
MLSQDVPQYGLKQGDVGTVVEFLGVVGGKEGYSVEFFDAEDKSVGVEMLDESHLTHLPNRTIQ